MYIALGGNRLTAFLTPYIEFFVVFPPVAVAVRSKDLNNTVFSKKFAFCATVAREKTSKILSASAEIISIARTKNEQRAAGNAKFVKNYKPRTPY